MHRRGILREGGLSTEFRRRWTPIDADQANTNRQEKQDINRTAKHAKGAKKNKN